MIVPRSARALTVGLTLAVAGLLVAGLVAATAITDSIGQLTLNAVTARQQSETSLALLSDLQDGESGQRGFLLTGRPAYLEPYAVALGQIDRHLKRLQELAAHTPWLKEEVAELETVTHAEVADLHETVTLAQQRRLGEALAVMNTDKGKAAMDRARMLVLRISARAEAERARGAAALQNRQRQFTSLLLLGLGAGVLLLGGGALALIWSRDRLMAAQDGERREALRLKATIEHVPDGVAVFDRHDRLTVVNTRFASTLGLDPRGMVPGLPFHAMAMSASIEPPLFDRHEPGTADSAEVRQGPRTLEVWRSPMPDGGQIVAVADVTRRVVAEEAARQSQKMDVLGQMTGGVAHDFNNLLQVVSANLELLRSRLERMSGTEALLVRLDAASGGVARGARLTRHLLAFARRQPLAPESIDASRLLLGMDEMLRRTVGERIQLELVIGGGLWHMRADPSQFENALLNLALNARDAMTDADGSMQGRLTIEAANASLDEAYAARVAEVAPGQYVMFAITDTGAGMTPQQCARAVEPFYTTKPEGRGTGLGLPMVLGFAKQSGGHFQLYSEPGRGTTVRLYIPRTAAPAEHADQAPLGLPLGQRQLVLVVEDDSAVRQVARDALQILNYQVVEAESADAACLMLERGCKPALLFTDVVMPGELSARGLARRARELIPGIGVLFTSGYTQNSIVHNGQLDADVSLLSKPWRQDDLARALRSVLDGTATRPPPPRRILLVEDEELVRMTTADALAELGFEVVQAATAGAALSRLSPPPDLLLSDLGLPDQDGLTLAALVRERLPALPVILASGNTDWPAGPPAGDVTWLPKPYDIQALRTAVTLALAAG